MTTKKHRSLSQVERDKRRISEMYLRGELQADIAAELKLSQSTVSNDLAALRDEWKASSLMDFNERRAQELAKTDDLEREYWVAWKRSQADAEKKMKKAIQYPIGIRKEQQENTETQTGDPRFLNGVQWCINKRCELLGLDAPKSIRQTNFAIDQNTPKPILRRIAAGMSPDVAYAEYSSGVNADKYGK